MNTLRERGLTMNDCVNCKHAETDYAEYYGTTAKNWFVCGCSIGMDPEENDGECEGFETYDELD